jgi:hypothetical protein
MTIKKTDLLVTAKQFLKTNLSEFKWYISKQWNNFPSNEKKIK